jgi:YVTN family beta-propeller protein
LLCAFIALYKPALCGASAIDLSQPFDVAITPDGRYAYVTNGGNNAVSVINIATNTLASTVTVGVAPFAVAITPDGDYAYVTNGGSASVSVISTTSNKVSATITVGIGPYGVAFSPDGRYAYVTNFGTSTVSVVSTALTMVVATVPVGNSPQGVAVSPDGQCVYVADFGAGTVSVISTVSNTVTATVTVEAGPNDVAVTPDGGYVYVVNSGSGSVSVIDTSTNLVIARVAGFNQPSGLALTPSGAYTYVSNLGGDTVSVINTATNTITAVLSAGRGPYGLAVTPNGEYVYVVNYDSATLSVVNTLPTLCTSSSPSAAIVGQSIKNYTAVALTVADQFPVPLYGGCITFAVNGTCSSVKFEDNSWTFTDLRLSGSEPLKSFTLSVYNSNVTVVSVLVTQNSTRQTVDVCYLSDNKGTQMLKLCTEADGSYQSCGWRVISANGSSPEGTAWHVLPDGAINITNAYGGVIVRLTASGDFFGNGEAYSDLPFLEQHSVAVIIGVVFAAAMAVAVVVKMKTREYTGEELQR